VFLLNNLFLTAVMLTVLVGTLYPLIAEAVRGVKVSVGQPFFNRMAVPAMVSLIFLMGVGPSLPWGSTTWADARKRLAPPAIGAFIMAAIAIIAGARGIYSILAFAFVGYARWAICASTGSACARDAVRMPKAGRPLSCDSSAATAVAMVDISHTSERCWLRSA
jgi:cytochrome c biogenesis factor